MNVKTGLNLELGKYQKQVDMRLEQFQNQNFVQRLWNKEQRLWEKDNLSSENSDFSLGWLNVVEKMMKALPMIEEFCKTIKSSGFDHALLLGMGGSSLAPYVFQETFKGSAGGIRLTILDSTDPDTIRKVENEINISKTLFIVSSKSGNTAEVMALFDYFYSRVYLVKEERAGDNFIAITDEGSSLGELALVKNFRKVFINFSDIGGRYSALSYFGIVPAALMGINVKELLDRTLTMMDSCRPGDHVSQNPGVVLGTALAELASIGCDKLTYLFPSELSAFGLWLEQLLAESTGKYGKGILPLKGDPLIEADTYGKDRVFVQLEFFGKQNDIQSEKLENFISMNYPVINILIKDELDLGKEFFRWEIATATAGAILGVNPFDQPNVQESKKNTDRLLKKIEHFGRLPETEPALIEDSLSFYTGDKKVKITDHHPFPKFFGSKAEKLLVEIFFHLIKEGDYIALQAYLPEEAVVRKSIQEIKQSLQKSLHVAITSEFGPRYLHSTGQYHKGGPNKGIFIQFICSSAMDIQIPERTYTFGLLKGLEAIGDMEALVKHGRRVILIDLGRDCIKGLNAFRQIIAKVQPALYNEDFMSQEKFINHPMPIHKTKEVITVNLN